VHVFHELPFPPALLDEIFRLLKPGGVMVLYDWVKRPLAEYLEGGSLDEDTLEHFREHCLFSAEDLEWMAERAGFHLRETVGRRGGRYVVVIAEKPAS
jgi:SAM-dependent methyltransferase